MRLAGLLFTALLTSPSLALAGSPTVSAELAVGAQDTPGEALVGWQPRLTFRLDRDDAVTAYARAGYTLGEEATALDGAVGVDGSACTPSGVCGGVRAGLGLQQATYVDEGLFAADRDVELTSIFLEIMPYVAYERLSLGLEAGLHKVTHSELEAGSADDVFAEGSVVLAVSF
jgi:hypothetical protein